MGFRGIKSNNFRTQNQLWSKVAKYGVLSLVKVSFKPRDPSIAGLFPLILTRAKNTPTKIRQNLAKNTY